MEIFELKKEWIKEERVNNPDCNILGYYKEYIFNDNYTSAFSLRVPLETVDIKPTLLSNNSGIEAEYDKVILIHDDGKQEVLFTIENAHEQKLVFEIARLKRENEELKLKLTKLETKMLKVMELLII